MKAAREAAEILVVDDDPRFHQFVERVAARLGRSCVGVRSGEEALRLLAARPFAMVVLDGLLPGIRGEEVARKTRERFPAEELPILFCSAFYRDMRSFRLLMNECGVTRIVHKPVEEEQFFSVLQSLLGDPELPREPPEPEERAELRGAYLATSLERVDSMARGLQALNGENRDALLDALRMEAHRFRGSGASFDLPEVSRLGGVIEDLVVSLKGDAPLGPAIARLEGLIDALRTTLSRAAGQAPIVEQRSFSTRPRILLVDDPESELARRVEVAHAEGLTVWCSTPGDAVRNAIELQVDVIFVAADGEDGIAGALPTLATLRSVTQAPLVLIARESGVQPRLQALEAGAKAVMGRPADAEALFRIATLYGKRLVQRPILLLGRDVQMLSRIAETVAFLGLAAVPCADPNRIFTALDDHRPSVLLLDADPDFNEAMALVRLLRGDLRHVELPILVATGRTDREAISEAFASGATACIGQPVSLLELEPLLSSWAVEGWERSRELLGLDVSTGLMGKERFERALGRSLGLAKRQGNVLSVAGFETGLAAVRRKHGDLRCEELAAEFAHHLLTTLRVTDVVARWGRDRFLVLLPGARAEDARRVVGEKLDWLKKRVEEFGARPAAISLGFPDVRASAQGFIDRIGRELDASLPKEYWEADFVVEVER